MMKKNISYVSVSVYVSDGMLLFKFLFQRTFF